VLWCYKSRENISSVKKIEPLLCAAANAASLSHGLEASAVLQVMDPTEN
jgi:hypothetical protein